MALELPFDRLYLEEEMPRRAEARLLQILGRDPQAPVSAWVRVRHGQAVLEDVEVAGRSIRELARNAGEGEEAGPGRRGS